MEPFKLMETPFLVFQKIIKLMRIIEVFEMSQTSKRMFVRIKNSRRRVQPIFLFKQENGRSIGVYEKNDVNSEFTIHLTLEKWEEDVQRQLTVDGTIFHVW
ncbi:hypothetical protein GCK72_003976 [Caenorhabditis remanei]|uniref:F-box domain-containing protein n=1 Tax=Caenorhabditis remanei TaxID=31234 RepID=A0A6A5H860_CAERE|nr:hypothetical protein GCK72_003976 [Caenorhabditis remanei]KAF1764030.1 hypothetical protein GCK72_003976 [Caenorhabditis remanei]